jgi:hypothetical protein
VNAEMSYRLNPSHQSAAKATGCTINPRHLETIEREISEAVPIMIRSNNQGTA